MEPISNTTLLIGASSSFGLAIAKALTNDEQQLIITHNSEIGRNMLSEFNQTKSIKIFSLDVTDESLVTNFAKQLPQSVNNIIYSVSAPLSFKSFREETWADYEIHWQTQVKGLWFIIHEILLGEHNLKNIIAIGSTAAFSVPPARLSSYNTAKYALIGLMRSMAVELAPLKIAVNLISPGVTGQGISNIFPDKILELAKAQTPFKRLANADDVVLSVRFLLSQKEAFLTGLNIPLDGGLHMN